MEGHELYQTLHWRKDKTLKVLLGLNPVVSDLNPDKDYIVSCDVWWTTSNKPNVDVRCLITPSAPGIMLTNLVYCKAVHICKMKKATETLAKLSSLIQVDGEDENVDKCLDDIFKNIDAVYRKLAARSKIVRRHLDKSFPDFGYSADGVLLPGSKDNDKENKCVAQTTAPDSARS